MIKLFGTWQYLEGASIWVDFDQVSPVGHAVKREEPSLAELSSLNAVKAELFWLSCVHVDEFEHANVILG